MKLGDIAEKLGFSVVGNCDRTVSSVKFIEEASEESLVYAGGRQHIKFSGQGVLISSPGLFEDNYDRLICFNGEDVAAVQCAELLIRHGELPDYKAPVQYQMILPGIYAGNNVHIGQNVVIEPFCTIDDNVTIGNGCFIGTGSHIGSGCTIGDNVMIGQSSVVGANAIFHVCCDGHLRVFGGLGTVMIGSFCNIGCNTVIQRGTFSNTVIGQHNMIGDLVDVGHDVKTGSDCRITSQSGISGNAKLGDRVCILGQSGVAEYVAIGHDTIIKGRTAVIKNTEPFAVISGSYGRNDKEELRLQANLRRYFKERKSD